MQQDLISDFFQLGKSVILYKMMRVGYLKMF